MTLPAEYCRYPLRRFGMDHDLYTWSPMFRRQPIVWPGGARIALWVATSVEWFPLTCTNTPFRPPNDQYVGKRPYPDYRAYTHLDYGNRVGVFRLMTVLDHFGISASAAVNAAVGARYPFVVEEMCRRDWEIVAHGLDMNHLHSGNLAADTENAWIAETVEILRHVSGQPVTGWLSPEYSESEHTLELLPAHGIQYVCDWVNDELPYPIRTAAGLLHAMPHPYEISDRLLLLDLRHSEEEFVEQICERFDVLYGEAAHQGGRIMGLSLHPWIIGHPHRIGYLDEILTYILKHAGVWPATGRDILEAVRTQLPPSAVPSTSKDGPVTFPSA